MSKAAFQQGDTGRVEPNGMGPIILGPDNRVMDGMHLVARVRMAGKDTIRAVRLQSVPEPDFLDCKPEDLTD